MESCFMRLLQLFPLVAFLALVAAVRADEAPANIAPIHVTINAEKTGPPINPFIFGQFIEHLGRCIYGGIWAEMLEDRKFYFPITDEYRPYRDLTNSKFPVVGASPWQVIGPAGSVTTVKDKPLAVERSPKVAAGSGIQQSDLGLVVDKEYAGYVR